jgi:hypothetical protein
LKTIFIMHLLSQILRIKNWQKLNKHNIPSSLFFPVDKQDLGALFFVTVFIFFCESSEKRKTFPFIFIFYEQTKYRCNFLSCTHNFCSGNACYHSVQNLLSSRLLSKNIKIRIYKTIILPVVLYGCETWSLTIETSGVWEQGVEVNIWTKEGWSDRRLEKAA